MSRTALFLTVAAVLGFVALGKNPPAAPPAPTPAPAFKPPKHTGLLEVTAQSTHQLISSNGGEVTAQIDVRLPEGGRRHIDELSPRCRADGDGGLGLRACGASSRSPVSVALVIDRSGSMEGEKLVQAKRAARAFVEKLEPEDNLAVIHFGTDVTRLPLHVMNEAGKVAALSLIDSIRAEGGTNIGDGLRAGFEELRAVSGSRRLVLASDGNPTVGTTSTFELLALAASIHEQAVAVTALGIGTDYNGQFMIALAERGGGFYGYLREAGQLEEVLAQELEQARTAVLRNVKLVLNLAPGVSLIDVPGRTLLGSEVRLPDLKRGDSARIFVRVRVPAREAGTNQQLISALASGVLVRPMSLRSEGSVTMTSVLLSVGTSNDAVAVEGSKNEPIFSSAVSALGSVQLIAAAAAIEAGDSARATSLLDSAHALFGMSVDALAGNEQVMLRARAAPNKESARMLQNKSMSSFGSNNSY